MSAKIYQGEDKTLTVSTNIDLSSHAEIEFRIDTPDQVVKKLTDSDITNVSSTGFNVSIAAADTETVKAGKYKMQVRATDSSGVLTNGKFQPNQIEILDSIFTTAGSGKDYN